MAVARKIGGKTRYPGVWRTKKGFIVKVKVRNPKTGKPRQVERHLKDVATPSEAAKRREELRVEVVLAGEAPRRRRVEPCATSWMRSKAPTLKKSTRKTYATAMDVAILPAFADYYIDAMTHDGVVEWRDTLAAGGREPETVNGYLRVFKTFMRDMVAQLRLPYDPTARVKPIRLGLQPNTKTTKHLTADELRRLLAYIRESYPQWYPVILTLALTGARFGAVSALKWTDIDFDEQVIRFRRAQWRQHVDTTKTGKTRTVPISGHLASVLRAHRRRLIERQAPGLSEGWAFPSAKGTLLYPGSLQKPLNRASKAIGMEKRFTPKGFRHTFNNLARRVASTQVVQSVMGHSTDQMTEHYSHVGLDEKRALLGGTLKLVGMDRGMDDAPSP